MNAQREEGRSRESNSACFHEGDISTSWNLHRWFDTEEARNRLTRFGVNELKAPSSAAVFTVVCYVAAAEIMKRFFYRTVLIASAMARDRDRMSASGTIKLTR